MPSGPIEVCQVAACEFLWIEQRRNHNDRLAAKSGLFYGNAHFANRQEVWQRVKGFLIHIAWLARLWPADDVIMAWAWEQDLLDALPGFPKPRQHRAVAGRHYLTKAAEELGRAVSRRTILAVRAGRVFQLWH